MSLSGSLADKLAAVAAAGFDGVEVFENDLISSPLSPPDVAARAADLGLTVELYQPFRDPDSTDAARVRRSRERLRHKLDVTRELGCDLLLVCSTVAPDAVTDDDRLTEQLHALADLAAERGVRLAYEALAWGTHVRDYGHAWSVVQRADHPALGTCLDSFHVLSRADDPAGIRDIPGEKILFLQLADAPHLAMDVLPWSRHFRCFPGQGTFDLTGFAAQVHAAGYRGPWSLEVFNDVFRESATGRTATDARRSLLHLQEQVARAAVTQPQALNDRPPLFVAPQPAPVHGVVSLRFAAGTAAPELVAVLDALGFRFVGRTRSTICSCGGTAPSRWRWTPRPTPAGPGPGCPPPCHCCPRSTCEPPTPGPGRAEPAPCWSMQRKWSCPAQIAGPAPRWCGWP